MFDTYRVEQGGGTHHHNHKHNIEVQEHRAPTDESVRLLNEMEAKARENLQAVHEIKNNLMQNIFVFQYGARPDIIEYCVAFKLNHKQHSIVYKHPTILSYSKHGVFQFQEIAKGILEEVAKYIAQHLMEISIELKYSKEGRLYSPEHGFTLPHGTIE